MGPRNCVPGPLIAYYRRRPVSRALARRWKPSKYHRVCTLPNQTCVPAVVYPRVYTAINDVRVCFLTRFNFVIPRARESGVTPGYTGLYPGVGQTHPRRGLFTTRGYVLVRDTRDSTWPWTTTRLAVETVETLIPQPTRWIPGARLPASALKLLLHVSTPPLEPVLINHRRLGFLVRQQLPKQVPPQAWLEIAKW